LGLDKVKYEIKIDKGWSVSVKIYFVNEYKTSNVRGFNGIINKCMMIINTSMNCTNQRCVFIAFLKC